MSTTTLFGREGNGSDIAGSFGAASAIVIAGVFAAWVFVKHDATVMPDAPFIDSDAGTVVASAKIERGPVNQPTSTSLLEQAEIAFAAGRIIEPEFDNALNYYRSLLEAEPGNKDATQGIDRVIAYLENQAEGAAFQNDWEAARAYAAVIVNVRPDDAHAQALRKRINRLERIQMLTARALDQSVRGNLVSPKGDNAAESYREIIALDANNSVAAQGMRSIVQRMLANAQSALIAGEQGKAQKFVESARAIDPRAPSLAEIDRTASPMRRVDDRSIQNDLLAASEALQADRLMPPAMPNAYDLFKAVLARDPNSDAALQGINLVRNALADRAETLIASGSLDQADAALLQAKVVGADSARVAQLQQELAYQTRLSNAREGRFDRLYAVSELKVRKQVAPAYPRSAEAKGVGGWVNVEFTVTDQGEVRDAKVRESSESIFEAAATAAISRWRFEPVVEDGRPVPVRGAVRFTFKGGATG